MAFLGLLNSVISTVYPVVASYRAFEDYSRTANRIATSHFKIGGVTVPLNLVFKQSADVPANDEHELQTHLISIQKWFIYWVVLATVQLAESVLFVRHIIPLYSFIRLAFSIWLLSPMISFKEAEVNPAKSFDNTQDWTQFTQNGCGLVYFSFIKPWIDTKFDEFAISPQRLLSEIKYLVSFFGSEKGPSQAATANAPATSPVPDTGILDSSYVIVKDFTSKLGYSAEETSDVPHDDPGNESVVTHREKRGWLW